MVSLHPTPSRQATRWQYQVIIRLEKANIPGAGYTCAIYSVKSQTGKARDRPCEWTTPVAIDGGDSHQGPKWFLPINPGGSFCRACIDAMLCGGRNFPVPIVPKSESSFMTCFLCEPIPRVTCMCKVIFSHFPQSLETLIQYCGILPIADCLIVVILLFSLLRLSMNVTANLLLHTFYHQ